MVSLAAVYVWQSSRIGLYHGLCSFCHATSSAQLALAHRPSLHVDCWVQTITTQAR